MRPKHGKHCFRFLPIWAGVLSLVLGFPLLALASGYGHGDVHHATGKISPHKKGKMGEGSHGSHQSASKFIDHILKFKDGMAITDDQAAKLQTIKTSFVKTKIKMNAEIKLTSVDLHDLLRDDKGSLNEVEAKLKELYDTRAGMYFASVKASREAKAVLTEEQRARMKTVHDRINAYKGTGMGEKGHPGGYKHHGKEKKS